MFSVLVIVLPIFALIFAGWTARRIGVLGPHATGELNRFVVYLALPALLFDIIANAQWHDIFQPAFISAFALGTAIVFIAAIALRLCQKRPLADAAIDGLNAAYANTGFVGFPLLLAVIGPAALSLTLLASILTVCVFFAIALVLIEAALQAERHPGRMAMKVLMSLARNPLIIAPAAGGVLLALALPPPAPVESFIKLLGSAASPCALVALGLFLAEDREATEPTASVTAQLVALKLVAHPLATWLLAAKVFRLPPDALHAAVLLAALPTGTGSFMVAEHYRRDASITSRVVLVSTIVSVATITLLIAWLL